MATPHNEADVKEVSNIVIMCGDPLRVKRISEKYLTNGRMINKVRNMYGYTGYYKDKLVTIFAHGMGNPSMGIYSYELFNNYNVDYIIRIGTCGSYDKDINLLDKILVTNVYSESAYGKYLDYHKDTVSSSDYLNDIIRQNAHNSDIELKEGKVHSTDAFYTKDNIIDIMKNEYNCIAVEMECYSLFVNAYLLNKKASCVLTVTDNIASRKRLNADDRVNSLDDTITLVLESILKIK